MTLWTGLLLFPLSYIFYVQTVDIRSKENLPVVEGTVVDRYYRSDLWIAKRPLIVIQPDQGTQTVEALLKSNDIFAFRKRVKFHYSGDPSQEVLLVGEHDPKDLYLLLFCLPFVFGLLLTGIMWRQQRQSR